jgi:TP901 family phage tail tape measure protein
MIKLDAIMDAKTFQASVDKGVRAWNRKNAGKSTLKLKIDEKGFRQPLGRITGDVNMFDDALAASNARVIAFGASTAVIGGMSKAFSELAKSTIEVQKSFSEINRILDLSTKRFEKFGNQLFDISKKNATSFQDTTKAALEFARQGLKTEETLKRTADALTLVRLTGINADKAVSSLTATVNAFDSAMVTTTTAVNKFVAVETKFAVGARDLVEAVGRVGSSARDAKVGFDELNAMITSVQQTTGRGGAVIGNAMKTIFTRLQRQSTLDALESFNVAVRDVEGNTLPAMKILDNFAKSYKGLKDASQGYLREQVAGVFQANILSAILRDLNKSQPTYAAALKVSTAATNEADKATAKLNQSLSALITQTGTEFKRLQENIGKATFEPIARSLMEPLKGAMEGLNELLDGEGVGSEVANGILNGIRNVIGGPGLVAIGGIILKVFYNTVSYMAKALPSLVGMTTETQKRATLEQFIAAALAKESDLAKAVAAAEGNAAQQANLLLGYANKTATAFDLQEASVANIAAMMARNPAAFGMAGKAMSGKGSFGRGADGFIPGIAGEVNDIRRGVGGVSPASRPVKIPNFSFGGGARGTMVANTGEYMVPNYKGGGSAIFNPNMVAEYGMPAGAKPVRGAGGYVPNFVDTNKLAKFQGKGFGKLSIAEREELSQLTGRSVDTIFRQGVGPTLKQARTISAGRVARAKAGVANTFTSSSIAMLTPPAGIGAGNFGQSNFSKKNPYISGKKFSVKYPKYTYNPKKSSKKGVNIEPIEEHIENGIIAATRLFIASIDPPAKGLDDTAMKAALNTAQGGAGAVAAAAGAAFEVGVSQALGLKAAKLEKGKKNLDVPSGNVTDKLRSLFSGGQTGAMLKNVKGADFKVSDSKGSSRSMAEKIMAIDPTWKSFRTKRMGRAARGYVPNFAALGDAVEREAAAGVPLGSIRVNRSSRLSSPNNPVGLGVTNTRDEPRGLTDVMGAARGFVPNFQAVDLKSLIGKDIGKSGGRKVVNFSSFQRALDNLAKKLAAGAISEEKAMKATEVLGRAAGKTGKTLETLKTNVKGASTAIKSEAVMSKKPGFMSKVGNQLGGMGGIGLSIGAPMLAGALEQAAGKPTAASGALQGVGTGAAMGMILGPWGTAIGAAVGGLYGLTTALGKSEMTLAEVAKFAEEFSKQTKEVTGAGEAIIQAQKDIIAATSQQELENAQKRLADNFEKIKGTELEKSFALAAGNVKEMSAAVEKYADIRKKENVLLEGSSRLGAMGADVGEFRKTFMKGGGYVTKEDLINDTSLIEKAIQELQTGVMGERSRTELEAIDMVKKMLKGEAFTGQGLFLGKELDTDAIMKDVGLHQFFDTFLKDATEDQLKDFGEALRTSLNDGLGDIGGLEADKIKAAIRNLPAFQGVGEKVVTAFASTLDDLDQKWGGAGLTRELARVGAIVNLKRAYESLVGAGDTGQIDALVADINTSGDDALQSFFDVKNAMQEVANILKKAGKFSEAFQKLNTAYAQIGASAMKETGDTVGAIEFKGARQAAGRKQKRIDFDRDFGLKNQASIIKNFGDSVTKSAEALGLIHDATSMLMANPELGIQKLENALEATFLQQAYNPQNLEKFKTTVANLRYAYDVQKLNNKYADIIAKANLDIETIKAENLIKENTMQAGMKQMVTRQKLNTVLQNVQLDKQIKLLELEKADPRNLIGVRRTDQVEKTFDRDKQILRMQRQQEDVQRRQENLSKLGEIRVQIQQIENNKQLIRVQSELRIAVENLTSQMARANFNNAIENPKSALNQYIRDLPFHSGKYGGALGYQQSGTEVRTGMEGGYMRPGKVPITESVESIYERLYGVKLPPGSTGTTGGRGNLKAPAGVTAGPSRDMEVYKDVLKETRGYTAEIAKIATVEGQVNFLKEKQKEAAATNNVALQNALSILTTELGVTENIVDAQRKLEDIINRRTADQEKSIMGFMDSFKGGMSLGFDDMLDDTQTIFGTLGRDLPTAFRDGMTSAMESAMDGAESFSDALRGSAIEFLKIIRRAALESAMSNITGLMGIGVSKDFRTRIGGNNRVGGFIGAQNGMYVSTGAASGDSVPAMLEKGEYVLNRKAVAGMGGPRNVDKVNFGAFPRQQGGSMSVNESASSNRMSGFFLASDNPELAEARDKAREEYDKRMEKRAKKKAMRDQFLSTLMSTGISMGISAVGSRMQQRSSMGKMQKMTAGTTNKEGESLALERSGSFFSKKGYEMQGSDAALAQFKGQKFLTDVQATNLGLDASKGPIKLPKRFKRMMHKSIDTRLEETGHASAGFGKKEFFGLHSSAHGYSGGKGKGPGKISGGYINRDSVPAYLAGGEYVMNSRAVKKYGLGFMGRLNGGVVPGYQVGGSVGADASPQLNAQTGANTNNISINVNVGGGGKGSGQGPGQTTGNVNADEQTNEDNATQGKALSNRIKAAVLEVIASEQRLGGSLSKTGRAGG